MKQLKNLFLIFVVMVFSRASVAHTGLLSSSPEDGGMLSEAPQRVVLQFGSPVRVMKLMIVDDNNQSHDIHFSPMKTAQKTFTQPLPQQLKPSRYTVKWMAMGGDSHKIDGQFQFHLHGNDTSHAHHD